jgi:hypothetical protein
MSALAAGCVLPVAPEFQNPPTAPNYPPYFIDSNPPFLTTVAAGQILKVQVSDPNPGDTLSVRWASDYPKYSQTKSAVLQDTKNVTISAAELGLPFTTDCKNFAPFAAGAEHKLVIIVSDRPLSTSFLFTDDLAYNRLDGDMKATFPIMSGWTISGCP